MSNEFQNTHKNYDASDMHDIAPMAECDMEWMNIVITDVRKRISEIKTELGNKNIAGFYALEKVLEIYKYVADDRLGHHAEEAEKYKAEWKANKGGNK